MIKLTKEQEELIIPHCLKWLDLSYSTDNSAFKDTTRIEELITQIYINAELSVPENFHYFDSPMAIKRSIENQFGEYDIYWCYGSNDYYLAEYDFLINYTNVSISTKLFEPFIELAKLIYWWVADENDVWISKKPNTIKINGNKIHCANGPAMIFDDGFVAYYIDGKKLTKQEFDVHNKI